MTREEFDTKYGHSFFLKHNKWGKQLTNDEATKVAGTTVTGGNITTNTRTASRSSISINSRK